MAAPESVRQPGGLGIGYSFTPSQYHPQAVNVPTEAGALWARAGELALKTGQIIGNLPGQISQEQLDVANAHAGLQHIKELNASGAGKYTMGIDASGHAYTVPVSSITNPALAMHVMGMMGYNPKVKDDTNPPPPTTPPPPPPPAPSSADLGKKAAPGTATFARASSP